jgi:hypothetical protein
MGANSRRHPRITGNLPSTIPIIQTGPGGGDPKPLNVAVQARPRRLNHCGAAFLTKKAAHRGTGAAKFVRRSMTHLGATRAPSE